MPSLNKVDYICQNFRTMNRKKDLVNLHIRIKPITYDKLKAWSDELGNSMGELIDSIVDGYEDSCKEQDEWLKDSNVYEQLSKLMEKIDKISQKVGAE